MTDEGSLPVVMELAVGNGNASATVSDIEQPVQYTRLVMPPSAKIANNLHVVARGYSTIH